MIRLICLLDHLKEESERFEWVDGKIRFYIYCFKFSTEITSTLKTHLPSNGLFQISMATLDIDVIPKAYLSQVYLTHLLTYSTYLLVGTCYLTYLLTYYPTYLLRYFLENFVPTNPCSYPKNKEIFLETSWYLYRKI